MQCIYPSHPLLPQSHQHCGKPLTHKLQSAAFWQVPGAHCQTAKQFLRPSRQTPEHTGLAHTHTPSYIKLLSAQPTVIVALFYCMFVSALSCACIVLFLLQFLHTCSLCSPALIVCYMLHMTNAWREKLIWEIVWSARVEVGIRVV